MIPAQLSKLAQAIGARLAGDDLSIEATTSDSRQCPPGSLFIAIRGDRFDGHDYAAAAVESGAIAVLVERELPLAVPQLIVDDTLKALGKLGNFNRHAGRVRVAGLTGSAGKTTTREMIAAILGECGNVLATRGNLNNQIGAPLTLCEINAGHDFAVIEMGANHAGEIADITAMVEPEVALITNVGAAHLEGFGDIDGVFQAKSEIFEGLDPQGTAVINADSEFADAWRDNHGAGSLVTFGLDSDADYRAADVELCGHDGSRFRLQSPAGEIPIRLPLAGHHNIANALAAAAVAVSLGANLEQVAAGLAALTPVVGRLHPMTGWNQCHLIDDSYNANVGSVRAAIDLLASLPGRRILVLGDMAELGKDTGQLMTELGSYARQSGLDWLFTLGQHAMAAAEGFGGGAMHFSLREFLIEQLKFLANPDTTILIKGSRSARMEQIAQALASPSTGAGTNTDAGGAH